MPSRTICWVITTVFSTPSWKNARRCSLPQTWGLARLRTGLERAAWLLAVCLAVSLGGVARADVAPAEITQLRIDRAEDGVFLTATIRFELPPVVEDALTKGIAMYFVAEAEVYRDRWYWYDKRIATATRHLRLAYQPLTRRWRLNVSSGQIGNATLGATLGQNFDSLPEAMAAVQRIARWKVAEAAEVDVEARYNVDFRFRLDLSQLPRPFQIGAVGQADWNISVGRNQRLFMESAR